VGFRFFKRIRLARGVTMNLSKSGASVSLGPRGAKFTLGRRGARDTIGLPGTGMYYTTTSSWAHKPKKASSPGSAPPAFGSHPGPTVPVSADARASEASDSTTRSQRSGATLLWVLGIIVVILVWLGLVGQHNRDASMVRFLDAPYVGKDKESLKGMISARYVKDNAAENKLIAANRIFTVAADTKVRVIEIQNDKYVHLRIVSGPHAGEDGWVSRSWVKYEPTT
jgi:uncharacterized protein DUF4236